MDRLELLHRYKAGFEGQINLSDLRLVKEDSRYKYYVCPSCEFGQHYAVLPQPITIGLEWYVPNILHCYHTGTQWMVNTDIENIITKEEAAFNKLLMKADAYKDRVFTGQEAFYLHTTRGIPIECLNCSDFQEYDKLMEEHRKTSRA